MEKIPQCLVKFYPVGGVDKFIMLDANPASTVKTNVM